MSVTVGVMCRYQLICVQRKTVNDRDRRLMRQHGRIQRALTDAINGGIEDLYALLGFGPMGSRLLRRGPHRVAQTLIVMGILKTHHVRGCAPAPVKAVEAALRRIGYRMLHVSEWCTSKTCDLCGAFMIKTRGHSVRHWRCDHDAGRSQPAQQRDRATRHPAEQNKDVYASRSMVRIMISLLVRGRRPAHLTPAEASAKRGADGDSSAPKRKRLRRDSECECVFVFVIIVGVCAT